MRCKVGSRHHFVYVRVCALTCSSIDSNVDKLNAVQLHSIKHCSLKRKKSSDYLGEIALISREHNFGCREKRVKSLNGTGHRHRILFGMRKASIFRRGCPGPEVFSRTRLHAHLHGTLRRLSSPNNLRCSMSCESVR